MNETTPKKLATIVGHPTCFSVNFPEITLTSIHTVLEKAYLDWRFNPQYLFCSEEDCKKITAEVARCTNYEVPDDDDQDRSLLRTRLVNQITGRLMPVVVLPEHEDGTLLFGFITS